MEYCIPAIENAFLSLESRNISVVPLPIILKSQYIARVYTRGWNSTVHGIFNVEEFLFASSKAPAIWCAKYRVSGSLPDHEMVTAPPGVFASSDTKDARLLGLMSRHLAAASTSAARVFASAAAVFALLAVVSVSSWSLSPASKIPASPSSSPTTPSITAPFAALYKSRFFHDSESGHSPNSPVVNKIAEPRSIISETPSHDLASGSDNDLKFKIFHAYHIAAIANITTAMAILAFFVGRAIRNLIRELLGGS